MLNELWVLLPFDSAFGSLVAERFRAYGLKPPRLAVTSASINLSVELIATGHFLTVLPGFSLRLPRKNPFVRALPVELPDTRMPIAIITLKNRALSPIARLFIERVRAITKPLARSTS